MGNKNPDLSALKPGAAAPAPAADNAGVGNPSPGPTVLPSGTDSNDDTTNKVEAGNAAAAAASDAGSGEPVHRVEGLGYAAASVDTKEAAESLKKGQKAIIYNPSERPLRDPYTNDRYPPGETVRVKEVGNWTICQVAAGILRIGKADDLGLKRGDNSDWIADNPGKPEDDE